MPPVWIKSTVDRQVRQRKLISWGMCGLHHVQITTVCPVYVGLNTPCGYTAICSQVTGVLSDRPQLHLLFLFTFESCHRDVQ